MYGADLSLLQMASCFMDGRPEMQTTENEQCQF